MTNQFMQIKDMFVQNKAFVECKSEIDAINFLNECDQIGLKWCDHTSLNSESKFDFCESSILYFNEDRGVVFCDSCEMENISECSYLVHYVYNNFILF